MIGGITAILHRPIIEDEVLGEIAFPLEMPARRSAVGSPDTGLRPQAALILLGVAGLLIRIGKRSG